MQFDLFKACAGTRKKLNEEVLKYKAAGWEKCGEVITHETVIESQTAPQFIYYSQAMKKED